MRKKKEFIPPAIYDISIRGSEQQCNTIKKIVNELSRYGGVADLCPGKLFVPVEMMMMLLVGSDEYSGYVISMNTDDPRCVILHTETEDPQAICNAFKDCFSDIEIDFKKAG